MGHPPKHIYLYLHFLHLSLCIILLKLFFLSIILHRNSSYQLSSSIFPNLYIVLTKVWHGYISPFESIAIILFPAPHIDGLFPSIKLLSNLGIFFTSSLLLGKHVLTIYLIFNLSKYFLFRSIIFSFPFVTTDLTHIFSLYFSGNCSIVLNTS